MKTSITNIIKKVTSKNTTVNKDTSVIKKPVVKKSVTKKTTTIKKVVPQGDKKPTEKTIKKVSSTKVAKKSTPKKVLDKKSPELKKLIKASDKHSFWLNDGQILNDLVALANALVKMENSVYTYHTKNGRHDFANWIEDVLNDVELATALRKTKTPKAAHNLVVKHLRLYQF